MPDPVRDSRTFRFGIYELIAETGELRKDGKLHARLQVQPLGVLLMLIERRGEVVTREELRQKIWPANTFVDFDHGMNTAINKLRGAFGDSAANPRFIQTLPRIGYRFIAPVEAVDGSPTASSDPAYRESTRPAARSLLSDASDLPAAPHNVTRLLFSAIQVMYLVFYVVALAGFPEAQASLAIFTRHVFIGSVVLVLTAASGIPLRLYLLSAAAFRYSKLARNFVKLFPLIFPLDVIWALAPFLISRYLGAGLALGATAALLYLPFAQRSLLLMRPHPDRAAGAAENRSGDGSH